MNELVRKGTVQDLVQAARGQPVASSSENVILLLDRSGSMYLQGTDVLMLLTSAKIAAKKFVEACGPKTQVAVLAFDTSHEWISKFGTSREELLKRIELIGIGYDTFLEGALVAAINEVSVGVATLRRLVLMTDGIVNDARSCDKIIRRAADNRIRIETIAFGPNADRKWLSKVAEMTSGTFSDSPADAASLAKVFTALEARKMGLLPK